MKKLAAVCICILTLFSAGEIVNRAVKQAAGVPDAAASVGPAAVSCEQDLRTYGGSANRMESD